MFKIKTNIFEENLAHGSASDFKCWDSPTRPVMNETKSLPNFQSSLVADSDLNLAGQVENLRLDDQQQKALQRNMSVPIQAVDSQSIYASDPFAIASDVNVNNSIEVKRIERGSNSMDLGENPFTKLRFQNFGLTGSFEAQNNVFNRNSDGLDQEKNKQ
jgi:hypothetical protein